MSYERSSLEMVLCPRCNKNLSTNQALTYHLNRRTPCNSIQCPHCQQRFQTKLDLQMHMMRCTHVKDPIPDPSLLSTAFQHAPFGIVITVDQRVRYHTQSLSTYLLVDDTLDLKKVHPFRLVHEHDCDQYHIYYFQRNDLSSDQR